MMPLLSVAAQGVIGPLSPGALCLLAVPLLGVVYDLLSEAALRWWVREPAPRSDGPLEPISFFRPLKRGVPGLRDKLESLLASSLPEDQIILGVDPESEAETVGEELRRTHPLRAIVVVRCSAGDAMNPKISKLLQMEAVALHPAWLLCDSEIIFPDGFLEGFRREWTARGGAALTAGYRFVNAYSWPQRCDAVHVLLTLWPGLALVRRFGRVKFTLGACTLFRRDALATVGGWSAFGSDLGEDQRIGAALTGAGQVVHLSRHVATLDSDAITWRDYWRHQRRVAVTYRVANPSGFAGMLATYGPVWALLGVLVFPSSVSLTVFLCSVVFRGWRMWKTARFLDFPVHGLAIASAIASFIEALCWALSWFPARVWWSGRWWRIDSRGKLSRPPPSPTSGP